MQLRQNSIGLHRGVVSLQKHTPDWGESFTCEANLLKTIFNDNLIEIEHIGSTAIPTIKAKPIIDIAVLLNTEDLSLLKNLLEPYNYEYRESGSREGELFFAKGSHTSRTHYLHLYKDPSEEFTKTIVFRDVLRGDSDLALEYNFLKNKLARMYPNDRVSYTKGKADFIKKVLDSVLYPNQLGGHTLGK